MHYFIYTERFPSRRVDAPRQTGIGRYCADLAWGLSELGHEVTVLTNDEVGSEAPATPERFRVDVLGDAPRGPRAAAARGREVLRRLSAARRPACLLVGDPTAHTALFAASRPVTVPLCPIFYGTELAAWVIRADRSARALLRRWRLRRYLAASAMPVCISRFTAGLLRQIRPASGEAGRECIVYPCVSDLFLSRPVDRAFGAALRQRLTRDGSTPLILATVARISERKNQLAVLQALDRLRRDGAAAWHYFVIGNVDGPEHEAYAARLRGFTAERGLADCVTFVERATDEQKLDYLDACDASAMLSRTVGASVEGFGISVIEASARGKPVVVSDQGGMPETIVEGLTGFAVPPDDVARIAAALETLAGDPARRASLGEQGRRRTLDRFTPAATARVLHAGLAGRHAPRAPRLDGAGAPAVGRRLGQEC